MTPYRLIDRLYEPTSWTGTLLGLIAYYVAELLPPSTIAHLAEFAQTILATALFMFPENRIVVASEDLLKFVLSRFPTATDGKTASFGDGALHCTAGGERSLASMLMIGMWGLLALGVSACSTPPTPAEIQAVQSISSELACTTQAAANAATAGFEATGDTKNAQITSAASAATGSLCTGLAVGTALNTAAQAK